MLFFSEIYGLLFWENKSNLLLHTHKYTCFLLKSISAILKESSASRRKEGIINKIRKTNERRYLLNTPGWVNLGPDCGWGNLCCGCWGETKRNDILLPITDLVRYFCTNYYFPQRFVAEKNKLLVTMALWLLLLHSFV